MKKIKINIHYVFIAVMVLLIGFVAVRLYIWNQGEEIEFEEGHDGEADNIEVLDFILPLDPTLREGREDDGVTTIVAFGNAPFADDRNDEKNLANLIAKDADAVVYNCSFADSYMTALNPNLDGSHPYDAFSFYWLATTFTVDNYGILDQAMEQLEEVSADIKEAAEMLKEIDFEKVDIITIMYDSSDYLAGRKTIDRENLTDVQTFSGALGAGIQLIQQTYPHIRIIVMSPTYSYAIGEDGEEENADMIDYGRGPLSTYVILQSDTCYTNSVTFVDNYYGTINELDAKEYLYDFFHINEAGRQLLSDRFLYALNRYTGNAERN